MNGRYKNKYRISSTRLKSWNYGWQAAYFITICTHNREYHFGSIDSGHMSLSEIGSVVDQEWKKTFEIRPDMNLEMGEYIIMPNHFHAIVIIGENEYNMDGGLDGRDIMHCVSTSGLNKFGPQTKNLASIVRGFKSSVTTYARKNGIHDFKWQSRFHDHIIRSEKSFNRIQNYIINNPNNWVDDKFS